MTPELFYRVLRVGLYGSAASVSLWVAAFAFYGLRRRNGLPLSFLSIAVFFWNVSLLFLASIPRSLDSGSDFLVRLAVNSAHLSYSLSLPFLYLFARGDDFGGLRLVGKWLLLGIPFAANLLVWILSDGRPENAPIIQGVFAAQLLYGLIVGGLCVRTLYRRARDYGEGDRVSVARVFIGAFVFATFYALYRAGAFRGPSLDPSPIALAAALVIVAAGYRRLDPFSAAAENENRLKRFEFMADASQEYMSIINRDFRYEAVNAAFCASMHRSREEIVGRNVADLWGLEAFEGRIRPSIESCLAGSALVFRTRLSFGASGERDMEVSYFPFMPPGASAPTHAVVVTKDITAYVLKEKELEEARERADDANKAKSDFLASMSHEIRTPINAVMGLTELALRKDIDPELRDDLETVKAASVNLLSLVNDILDLSKIEAGGMRFERIPFSPRESIERIVKSFKPSVDRKGIALDLDVDGRLPELLMGDPLRFSQIMFNLIGNAVKFTDKGGVSVSVLVKPRSAVAGTLGSRVAADPQIGLRVEVRDTGIGIPAEKISTIFESFAQASAGTSRKYGGSGLGLTISRRLARLFGGDVSVESTLGSGSSFFFDALFEPAPKEALPPESNGPGGFLLGAGAVPEPESAGSGNEPSILLVEDNHINARVALRFLDSIGRCADRAESGAEALRLIAARRYGLVLMDVELPGMDGLETARRVRAGEAGAESRLVPIVAMTAHSGSDARASCEAAGMDDFLSKPIDFAELEAVLSRFERPYGRTVGSGRKTERPSEEPTFEQPILDRKSALVRLGGDQELLAELYGIFRSEASDRSSQALRFNESGDFASLAALAHQVKGSAASLGARRLAAAADELQKAAASRGDSTPGALENFLAVYALTYKALAS